MKISIIAAITKDNVIGRDGKLLFKNLKQDLKHFRELTTGHTVLMGSRTYKSLPNGALLNRRNIVLSRKPAHKFPGCDVYISLEEAVESCIQRGEEELFIIGGGEVYFETIKHANTLYITQIDVYSAGYSFGDVFFPTIGPEYLLVETSPDINEGGLTYRFQRYERVHV